MMLTKEQIDNLEVGDTFEAGTLLEGITKEPLLWECTQRTPGGAYIFWVTYLGAFFTRVRMDITTEGRLKWQEIGR